MHSTSSSDTLPSVLEAVSGRTILNDNMLPSVSSCSSLISQQGLWQLHHEHGDLEAAIDAFQATLHSMRYRFEGKHRTTTHIKQRTSAVPTRYHRQRIPTAAGPIRLRPIIECHPKHGALSPSHNLLFRYGFDFSDIAEIFRNSQFCYERTSNFSAGIVFYNLALCEHLLASSQCCCTHETEEAAMGACADAQEHRPRHVCKRRRRLDVADQYYEQAHRFMVGAFPGLGRGLPSPHPLLNCAYIACMNNWAHSKADLGYIFQCGALLNRLIPFATILSRRAGTTDSTGDGYHGIANIPSVDLSRMSTIARRSVLARHMLISGADAAVVDTMVSSAQMTIFLLHSLPFLFPELFLWTAAAAA